MHFYNNQQEWSPIEVEGNTIVYSLQSNGTFRLLDAARKLVFEFENDMQQDFTIDALYGYNTGNELLPGPRVASGTYYQFAQRSKSQPTLQLWIKSMGTDINSMQITCSNGAVSKLSKSEDLTDEYIRFSLYVGNAQAGLPCEIKVGNVLIVYIENISE